LRYAKVDEPGENEMGRPLSFGVSVAFGFALLIALGGLGVAARIPVGLTIVVFSVLGIGLQAAHVLRTRPRWSGVWMLVLGVEAVALGLVLVTQAGVGIAFRLSLCDDYLAYLPEARRLLATHTLLEPWSLRRLQNYGGQTFLQAAYIRFLGKDALGLAETLLPVALLWALLTTALRRPLARVLSLVPLLFLPFFAVPRYNTAGTLSAVPLLVALGALLLLLRRATQQRNRRGAIVTAAAIGLTAAGVVAIRTSAAPAAALIAVIGACMVTGTLRDRLRAATICTLAGVAAFLPWSAAMWESSGTPLYPLLTGNENTRVPSEAGTRSIDVSDFLHSERHFLSGSIYPTAVVVLLVIVLVTWRIFPTSAPVAALMALAALANMVLLAPSIAIGGIGDFDRYAFPVVAGVVFFVLRAAFVRLDEEESLSRHKVLAPALLTLAAVVAFFWIGTSDPKAIVKVHSLDDARLFVENAANIRDADAQITSDASVANARAALAAVPRHAKAILAVSEPDAFLTNGADFQSLDQPGSAAPGGEFPFFSGPEAKVRALRHEGYDYLIVSPGTNNICFRHDRIAAFLNHPVLGYRLLAPYVLDFFDDIDHLADRYPQATQMVQGFYVIDLRAVPGATPARAGATKP
jgi:hypothetical protein